MAIIQSNGVLLNPLHKLLFLFVGLVANQIVDFPKSESLKIQPNGSQGEENNTCPEGASM